MQQQSTTPLSREYRLPDKDPAQFTEDDYFHLMLVADQLGPGFCLGDSPLIHLMVTRHVPMATIFPRPPSEMPLTPNGQCPLFIAVYAKNTEALVYLLKAAPRMVLDRWHYSAMTYALRDDYLVGFVICLLFGHRPELLGHMAALRDNVWAFGLLHTLEFNLAAVDMEGSTPFKVAVKSYSHKVLEYMGRHLTGLINFNHPVLQGSPSSHLKALVRDMLAAQEFSKVAAFANKVVTVSKSKAFLIAHAVCLKLVVLALLLSKFSTASVPSLVLLSVSLYLFTAGCLFVGKGRVCRADPLAAKCSLFNLLSGSREPGCYQTAFHKIQDLVREDEVVKLDSLDVADICPTCLIFREGRWAHCQACGACVEGFHFHWLDNCVTRSNHVFYLALLLFHGWFLLCAQSLISCPQALEYSFPLSAFCKFYHVQREQLFTAVVLFGLYVGLGWLLLELLINLYCILNGMTYHAVFEGKSYRHLYQMSWLADTKFRLQRVWGCVHPGALACQALRNLGQYVRLSFSR